MDGQEHAALGRVRSDPAIAHGLDALAALPGADLTSALLGLFDARAGAHDAADIRRRSALRFVIPSHLDGEGLARARASALGVLRGSFEPIELAPAVPFGTHHVLGGVDQKNVVSAGRGLEMAADPTVGLALVAADRRQALLADDPRSDTVVRLAASQRITRTQQFHGPLSFAHFELVASVVAGRAGAGRSFEAAAAAEVLAGLVGVAETLLDVPVQVRLTELADNAGPVAGAIGDALAHTRAGVEADPTRQAGRAYYDTLCFKIAVEVGGEWHEVGDGGFVDWTARLLDNGKERLLTGAVSLDRLVALSSSS